MRRFQKTYQPLPWKRSRKDAAITRIGDKQWGSWGGILQPPARPPQPTKLAQTIFFSIPKGVGFISPEPGSVLLGQAHTRPKALTGAVKFAET